MSTVRYPHMATVKDAAAQFGVPAAYIRTLCRTGKARFVCAGNRWLVNMDSLAAYFNEGDDPAELGLVEDRWPRWVSVCDRLPGDNDGDHFIVYTRSGLKMEAEFSRNPDNIKNRTQWSTPFTCGLNVIYWMPFPADPKEAEHE